MAASYRASDADRDQVVELLHRAYVDGRITADEREDRVAQALKARTVDDLVTLTEDLIPPTPAVPARPESAVISTQGAVPESDRITAILATTKRRGVWRVRRHSVAHVMMGEVKLDLTEATFDAPTVEINGTHVMGSMVLNVPTGTTVRDETTSILGEVSIRGLGEPDPAMPTIVLTGTTVLAEIKVRGPKKPPPWRRALG